MTNFKVGDRVQREGYKPSSVSAEVLAVHGDYLWVLYDSGKFPVTENKRYLKKVYKRGYLVGEYFYSDKEKAEKESKIWGVPVRVFEEVEQEE